VTPEETSALVQAIVAESQRLGLTWSIRPATVNTDDLSTGITTATYDGDTTSIVMINLVGDLYAGDRVYAVSIPQGGNYIVGQPGRPGMVNPYGLHGTGVADTTSLTTFVNLTAPSSFTFTKRRDDTRVRVHMTVGFFVSLANTGMDAGVTFDGGGSTLTVTRFGATATAGVHLQSTGIQYHPLPGGGGSPLAAGDYTVQAQWRRETGSGSVSRDGQDWLSVECIEVAP